jgi:hypothetical protein
MAKATCARLARTRQKDKIMSYQLPEGIPKLYKTEKSKDPTVYAAFEHRGSGWQWFVTEYDPEDGLFFGLVKGFDTELGYFSVEELEKNHIPLVKDWTPKPLSAVKAQIRQDELEQERREAARYASRVAGVRQ